MLLGFTVNSQNLVETLVGIIGILSLIGSILTWSISQQISNNLGAKLQRQIDRNRVKEGIMEADLADIKNFLQEKCGYRIRRDFPSDALPDDKTQF